MDKTKAPKTQAERVFDKFGGVPQLHRALIELDDPQAVRSLPSLYRWNYPIEKGGTGGWVPTSALKHVKRAARNEGLVITSKLLYPEE